MIEVREMTDRESDDLIARIGYGHLACSRDDQPYVIPIHYVYTKPYILFYTTKGKKTDIIDANPKVCLQIEEIVDATDWRSVIVFGEVEEIKEQDMRASALESILAANPTLTPAISIRWMDNWIRENVEVICRINPTRVTGRYSLKVRTKAAFVQPARKRDGQIL